jgi:hypothetical protein
MEKCRDCNSTLKRDETQCYNCGALVNQKDSAQTVFGKRFNAFLNIAFICSCLLTVASVFVDFTPPFMRCLMLTFILLLLKSSSAQMMEKKKG